ncbi:MAG: hypothetical protein K1X67_13340 [Fimbriimonadaceae bacterium]|nr:hypothetical protein [Fimbriimonadaceae bacterium]
MEPRSSAAKLEGLAFTFCKAGTLVLLTGRFALPVISLLACVFFVLAYVAGQKESRCVLRYPLVIAGFWACVFALSVWFVILYPGTFPIRL